MDQLASHLRVFPEGQLVAVDRRGRVVGMAASLIIHWNDYDFDDDWMSFTDAGMFTNHDPEYGRTLYAAELMVDPAHRNRGVGGKLYEARRELTDRLGLRRIRAAAPLLGYPDCADILSPLEYVRKVLEGGLRDPIPSFQLKHGFQVLGVIGGYVQDDRESLGKAALTEWRNLWCYPYTEFELQKTDNRESTRPRPPAAVPHS
jgi:GNAT superfamily N-acetyltransferase